MKLNLLELLNNKNYSNKYYNFYTMRKIALLTLTLFAFLCNYAGTIIVINTNDSGPGTLRQAVADAAEFDTIRFAQSLTITGSNTISLSSEINIDKGLVFKGLYNSNDTLFISGNNTNRIFNCDLSSAISKSLTLDSMVLINGNAPSSNGGSMTCINVDSLILNNSIIQYNITSNSGGGISFESNSANAYVIINNSIIANNSANSTGGIYVNTTGHLDIQINNSSINNNDAPNNGGGIRIYSVDSSIVFIHNSTIANNSTNSVGGGFLLEALYASTVITNSSISDNIAGDYGGGVRLYVTLTSELSVTNSIINNNTGTRGGGIHVDSQDSVIIAIVNSEIINNTATSEGGGGIYAYCSNDFTSVEVINSTIANNSAASNGGGIYANSQAPTAAFAEVIAINSTIANNSTDANGGGIYILSQGLGTATITNSTLINNNSIGQGNGIYVATYSIIDVKGSILHNGLNNIQSLGNPTYNSLGYNIFNDVPTWAISTDLTNVTAGQLDLGILQNNGGPTQTMIPLCGSVALNAGDPNDASTPQNNAICQNRREIGAAESCNLINTGVTANGNVLTAVESGATYQWLDCDNGNNPISGATNQSYTALSNGNYAVVISQSNCTDTSMCASVTNVGIEKFDFDALSIYPNPVNSFLTIDLKVVNQPYNCTITTLDGKQMMQHLNLTDHLFNIDLSDYSKGVYLIQMQTGNNSKVFKIIKE